MENKELNHLDKEILVRLLEYCKYLYEEEKERTSRIEKKIDIFSLFLGGGVLVSLILPIDKIQLIFNNGIINQPLGMFLVTFYFVTLFMFFLSFIFTIRIYKVQKFERPSDTKIIVSRSMNMKDLNDFLSTIIADYAIAAARNHDINDNKADYLSKALLYFLMGVVFTVISIILYKGLTLLKGGI